MRILFLGDVVGRSGRDAIKAHMPMFKKKLQPDYTIINVENAAGGYGVTAKLAQDFFDQGADCLTTGNHTWDQKELIETIDKEPRLLRPLNSCNGTPGNGYYCCNLQDGRCLLVVNLSARLFVEYIINDPFAEMEKLLTHYRLGQNVQAIIVDFHGEATSEKMAFGCAFDGRVSAVIGTHTHVPTSDHRILPNGTAYLSDAGMCGDYDSVIGVKKELAVQRFTRFFPGGRIPPAEGKGTVCGVFFTTDDKTGLATSISRVQVGGSLEQICPDLT